MPTTPPNQTPAEMSLMDVIHGIENLAAAAEKMPSIAEPRSALDAVIHKALDKLSAELDRF